MKQFIFTGIWFFLALNLTAQNPTQHNIISKVSTKSNSTQKGAKGTELKIAYTLPSISMDQIDEEINNVPKFIFQIQILKNSIPIRSAEGWEKFSDKNGDFLYEYEVIKNVAKNVEEESTFFIPHAALSLETGTNKDISFVVSISGKDAEGKNYHQKTVEKGVKINMTPTYLFTLDIDFVEATILDRKERAWDYAFIGTSAPDMKTLITLGDFTFWKYLLDNTYMFNIGEKSKNIKFRVLQTDEIYLYFLDEDPIIDQTIGVFKISAEKLKPDTKYSYSNAFQNVKSCNFSYSVSF